jgi:methyltransferase family protein
MPDHSAIAPDLIQAGTAAMLPSRPPPKRIKVLLPVWGYDFTQQFLRVSLPTLMAPGNLPALAQTLPTEFIFLTGRRDEAMIREAAGYRRLSKICPVSFHVIDDLITEGNHSTTVTLAFAGAVRRTADAMLDTCFFFLVSDYIIADGSLASAIKLMLAGASAVQTGNFQIAAEDAVPWLDRELERGDDALVLPPRELMRRALTCIHPVTIANTVNLPVSHNSHSNRMFWRVDANTLIGRFYLMHMLCVRPEVVDFVIGASCDYSFIPEMCPSGYATVITDSDDYLVIEAQPRDHEAGFLQPGPTEPKRLAASLSEWTTALHRDNARHTLIFHAADLSPSSNAVQAEADAFVAQVGRLLDRNPIPHRGHPYWRGAIAAYHGQIGQRPDEDDWQLMLGRRTTWSTRIIAWTHNAVLGRVPIVTHWHPRWTDFQKPLSALARILAHPENRLLIVSGQPTPMTNWLADSSGHVTRIPMSRLLKPYLDQSSELRARFDACYLEITDREFDRTHLVIDQIIPLLKSDAEILVASFNELWSSGAEAFGEKLTSGAPQFFHRLDLSLEELSLVAWSRWRWSANSRLLRLAQGFFRRSVLLAPIQAIMILVQSVIAFGSNLASRDRTLTTRWGRQIVSSVFMRLRVTPGAGSEERGICGKSMPALLTAGSTDADDTHIGDRSATQEPQYERLLEIEQEVGLASLGLMTNQVWHEDPRRLTFILARYKFVSKMLSGYRAVAEVGCGDAFGTRIVQQEAENVTVYDFDPVFIRDIQRRQSARWGLHAQVHDILKVPLPDRYDAVYSLDVIEHIPADNEDTFIGNLCSSLGDHGVLIIGSPSLESQAYASPQSKIGHVNCKSGRALKLLLERHFHTVFLFSMNDEVVHTGYYPMAHYLFALCSNIRK